MRAEACGLFLRVGEKNNRQPFHFLSSGNGEVVFSIWYRWGKIYKIIVDLNRYKKRGQHIRKGKGKDENVSFNRK